MLSKRKGMIAALFLFFIRSRIAHHSSPHQSLFSYSAREKRRSGPNRRDRAFGDRYPGSGRPTPPHGTYRRRLDDAQGGRQECPQLWRRMADALREMTATRNRLPSAWLPIAAAGDGPESAPAFASSSFTLGGGGDMASMASMSWFKCSHSTVAQASHANFRFATVPSES